MCGLAGIISSSREETSKGGALDQMVSSLDHRGPDDNGCARFIARDGQFIGIGSTRLAIIDVSPDGHQPMDGPSGTTHIVYNGEVYNFASLRRPLGDEDQAWKSQTDTETVIAAYERWGLDCFPKLRGMFALAIWDARQDRLVLARDPLGIKPLYYYSGGGTFLFASEIRSLLATGLVPRALEPGGVASFLTAGAVQSPYTIVRDIRSVPPGHYLTIRCRDGRFDIEEVNYAANLLEGSEIPRPADRREATETLRSLLEESVRLHLVSDVPLAAFLSGGVDSSAIVALMSRVSDARAKTFSVVFQETAFTEQKYARLVADHFQSEHTEVLLSEQACCEMVPAALAAMDQPTIDGLNTYVISRAVKDAGITVALSGLGGDELFAGYPSFRRAVKLQGLDRIPQQIRRATAQAGRSAFGRSVSQKKAWQLLADGGGPGSVYAASRQLFSAGEISSLMLTESRTRLPGSLNGGSDRSHPSDAVNAISRLEIEGYMANMLLRDADQMSMACSLELRVPLVDSVVAPYVINLPGDWKMDSGRPKPLLLDALGDLIPEAIWRRPKMGFALPMERWMHSALRPDLERTFRSKGSLSNLGFSNFARTIWQRFEQRPRLERWSRTWSLHVLKNWCDINQVGP